MLRESLSIILTLLIAGALIGGIDFVWSNLDDTLDDPSNQLANGEGLASAKSSPAETERGDGLVGGRGAWNAQQLGDACNDSRPLGGGL